LKCAVGEPFDLVILDVMLPGKNSSEVCCELHRQGKDLAILMLTAKSLLTCTGASGNEIDRNPYVPVGQPTLCD
jgi:CheY-like chemotaxis protein